LRSDTRILGFTTDRFISLHQSNARSATGRYFQVIGNIHDIESYLGIDNALSLNTSIFLSHWGHLAIIFMWVSGNLFHIAANANYSLWIKNPIGSMPIAHGIWDPHFGLSISDAYSSSGSDYAVVISYSGIYNWLYSSGFTNMPDLYNFVIAQLLLAVISLLLPNLHFIYLEEWLQWSYHVLLTDKLASDTKVGPIFTWPSRLFCACFDLSGLRLNFHVAVMIGFTSIAWSAHLIHVAIPVSRGVSSRDGHNYLMSKPSPKGLYPFYTGNWSFYSLGVDGDNHVFASASNKGQAILTFLGGLESHTASLYLTDIAHHHLAVGVLFVLHAHLYSALYKAFGHRIRDILFVNGNSGSMISLLGKSLSCQLSLALAGLSVLTSLLAQQTYSLAPYPYLSYDYVTFLALYVHHSFIASFLMMGSCAHAAIFLISDYTNKIETKSHSDSIGRILSHKAAIISHLSFVCLWLGFHTLGVYVHNDTVVAFSQVEKQILIEPAFRLFQAPYQTELTTQHTTVASKLLDFILPLAPTDLLAHHSIALGLHVTVLILLKGSLDARGSKLMGDKIHFGYGFACDGPGRAGTCDISAWDSFYLAMFWSLNTDAWLMFYAHWKHLTLWQNTALQFDQSSAYLNAWFRDYLWFNSASLIRGYDALGANDLSVWAYAFLLAHLCWATGYMFLISWRGYWQELIDIILYMHLKTPILYDLFNASTVTPVALSIVQARFIGLAHFAAGFILTYSSFVIGATS
jgi:photosystem I P700 chlorophyll a apoprotein A2